MATFRDRFFTRQTAEAITAPGAILLAGGGAAVAIVAGAPLAVAGAVGAAAYAGWVALRMPRTPVPAEGRIDLRRLSDPWRWYVKEALDSQDRFAQAVGGARAGPLRDRLTEIGRRIDDGVAECWRIASRGQQLEAALGKLVPPQQLAGRIAELEQSQPTATTERLMAALRDQQATHQRIAQTAAEAKERLQVLEVRLDEAVARAVELSLRAGDPVELSGLGDDVDQLVGEMEALRHGLDETAGQTATM